MLKSYVDLRNWLENFIPQVYGKEELGLSRIQNLLDKLENPEKKFKSILVGGTSGKGTTAFYIARLLQYSKFQINSKIQNKKNQKPVKIGLHISPHLVYIGERIQILERDKETKRQRDKERDSAIPVKRLVGLVNEIKPVVDDIIANQPEKTPSYFEILVALSFLYFAQEKVDFAVVEVGLGGRLDATNVLTPEISVITNVGLDHTEILGNTIEKIAGEKAGIIKVATTVITGAKGRALKVIEKVAISNKASLINIYTQGVKNLQKIELLRSITIPNDTYRYVPYNVNVECALLSLTTVLELKMSLSDKVVKQAFSGIFAGRFEEIDKNVVVDGAHNPEKITALINFLRKFEVPASQVAEGEPRFQRARRGERGSRFEVELVIAFKKGKRWKKMVDLLMKNLPVKKVIVTEYQMVTDMGRGSAVKANEIKDFVHSVYGLPTTAVCNSQEAVFGAVANRQKDEVVLVTGSLYLVGEARTLWHLPSFT